MKLEEIIKKIKIHGGATLVFDLYQTHHILRFKNSTLEDSVILTTKKAEKIMSFSTESEHLGISRKRFYINVK